MEHRVARDVGAYVGNDAGQLRRVPVAGERGTGSHRFARFSSRRWLSWMFFVRPLGAIAVIGVSSLHCDVSSAFGVVAICSHAMAWLAAFVAYSMRIFGTMVPYYYLSNDPHGMGVHFVQGLYGILLSPSRGIFIYSPVFVRRALSHRAILAIDRRPCARNRFALRDRGNRCCRCGASGMVGWKLLRPAIAERRDAVVRAARDSRARRSPQTLRNVRNPTIAVGTLLLVVSVVINAHGAFSFETLEWNCKAAAPRQRCWTGRGRSSSPAGSTKR